MVKPFAETVVEFAVEFADGAQPASPTIAVNTISPEVSPGISLENLKRIKASKVNLENLKSV
jgi:hypothetical protein